MEVATLAAGARPIAGKVRTDEIPDTYEQGRPCVEPGCVTLLCIYNPGPWCYVHAAKHQVEPDTTTHGW